MAIANKKVIRFVLGQGGKLFPGLAARAGFELFCRSENPRKPGTKQRQAIAAAAPKMAQARLHWLKARKGCVAAHEFRPNGLERGRILVVHGWRSRTDFMSQMIVSLVDDGWRVIGLDLPGHGRSSGRRLNVRLGVEAINLAAAWLGPFDVIVGHSFGGVAAVNAAIGGIGGIPPVSVPKLALISAPNSMPEIMELVADTFDLGRKARKAMHDIVEKVAGQPLPAYVLSDQLKGYDGEVLSIHARDDKEVLYRNGEAIGRAGSHVHHMPVDGLGHRRIVNDGQVFEALRQFAGADLPSQARAA
jgi:hypothetical protein